MRLSDGTVLPLPLPPHGQRFAHCGRARQCAARAGPSGRCEVQGVVELAEISGSDTFVHVDTPVGELVAQLTGVHYFDLGAAVTLYFNPAQLYVFDASGALLLSPVRGGGR